MRVQRILAALTAVAISLTACDASDPDGEGASVVEAGSDESDAEPEASEVGDGESSDTETEGDESEEEVAGTRENPLAIGTTVEMGDYEVAVTDVDLDATQENLDDNEFNEDPPEGTQYVLVSLEGTYVGEDSGDPGFDLAWKILGADNNTFDATWEPEDAGDFFPSCTLDTMYDIGETFPDGSWAGKFCLLMPSAQVDGSLVIVENFMSLDNERVFWLTQ